MGLLPNTLYLNHTAEQKSSFLDTNSMAFSMAITASLQRPCSPHHVTKKQQQQQTRPARSIGTKQETHVIALETEGPKGLKVEPENKLGFNADSSTSTTSMAPKADGAESGLDPEPFAPKFSNERWKNGTWDLNMFVRDGKMDWDGVIVAEARRRKFLEMYPESATNQEPVLFRSSIIPWWAWMKRSHLPEAELINGRAAMVGFFVAYLVDALTGLDVVGQTGNLMCKAGLLVSVMGVVFLRRAQDFDALRKLAEEATLYDKQWQSSWQDQDAGGDGDSGRGGKKNLAKS